MLQVYIGNLDKTNKSICEYNDAWFDKYIDNITFNEDIIKIIKLIDKVEYIGNHRVKSKFSNGIAISVKELSSGCKTVINVANFNNIIFSIAECGDNALQVLFKLKRGKVYLPFFILPREFVNDVEIIYNEQKIIIHNNMELEELLNKIF